MFTVFKDKTTGKHRWVTCSSNAYKDRDSEIVSQKALENDVENSDKDGNYGPLRIWHIMYDQATNKGLDIGDCDFRMMYGKTLVESGTFKNERIAHALHESADNFQVSIGFNHPRDEPKDGVFYTIKTFERSLVPKEKVSNPFTNFNVFSAKERKNAMNTKELQEKKIAEFKSLLPDEGAVDEFLSNVQASEKQADGMGIAFKGFDWNKLSPTARLELAIQEAEYFTTKEAESETIPTAEVELEVTLSIPESEDTTTKGAKKAPKVKVEIEEEEDMDEEDEETSMKADEEYMSKVMSPMVTELKACMDGMKTELKGWFQDMMKKKGDEDKKKTEKEASDLTTVLEVSDSHTSRIAQLEATVKELNESLAKTGEALEQTTKELIKLTGEQPPVNQRELAANKSFLGLGSDYSNGRPTQNGANVIKTETALSEEQYKAANTPHLVSFIDNLTNGK